MWKRFIDVGCAVMLMLRVKTGDASFVPMSGFIKWWGQNRNAFVCADLPSRSVVRVELGKHVWIVMDTLISVVITSKTTVQC